jgi:hypothetical protein
MSNKAGAGACESGEGIPVQLQAQHAHREGAGSRCPRQGWEGPNRLNEGRTHDVVDNKWPIFGTHDVYDNKRDN